MTVDEAISEWASKKRRMGCMSAANWFCQLLVTLIESFCGTTHPIRCKEIEQWPKILIR